MRLDAELDPSKFAVVAVVAAAQNLGGAAGCRELVEGAVAGLRQADAPPMARVTHKGRAGERLRAAALLATICGACKRCPRGWADD